VTSEFQFFLFCHGPLRCCDQSEGHHIWLDSSRNRFRHQTRRYFWQILPIFTCSCGFLAFSGGSTLSRPVSVVLFGWICSRFAFLRNFRRLRDLFFFLLFQMCVRSACSFQSPSRFRDCLLSTSVPPMVIVCWRIRAKKPGSCRV